MTQCYYCGAEMIWQSDIDVPECGVVTYLNCPNCNAMAEFSMGEEE